MRVAKALALVAAGAYFHFGVREPQVAVKAVEAEVELVAFGANVHGVGTFLTSHVAL